MEFTPEKATELVNTITNSVKEQVNEIRSKVEGDLKSITETMKKHGKGEQ